MVKLTDKIKTYHVNLVNPVKRNIKSASKRKRMSKLSKKIKASTLIEALVAMIIIVVIYGIGLTIFINVNKANNNRLKIEAFLQLEDIVAKTKKEARYLDETYDLNNMKIEKTITKYDNNNSLNLLQIKVLSKENKLLTEHREIIKVNLNE